MLASLQCCPIDRSALLLRSGLLVVMLLLPLAQASAHHLHYVPLSDSRFPTILADIYGETPLQQWISYEGGDSFTSYDLATRTFDVSSGTGVDTMVFDYPFFEDITDSQTTAFFELEIRQLDTSGVQTFEYGLTDLDSQVKWDEAAGTITGSKSGVSGDNVSGLPRISTLGDLPLRLQAYYNFAAHVLTLVLIDDATGTSRVMNWQGSANPFTNFYGDVDGTDPDNLDIYSFVLCEAACSIRALRWGRVQCDVSGGAIDLAGCGVSKLAVSNSDGQDTYQAGGSLTYAVSAYNFDQYDVSGAKVGVAFPPGLSCNWSCYALNGASCPASGTGDVDETVDLPRESVVTFVAGCAVDSGLIEPLVTTATISQAGEVVGATRSATDIDLNINDLVFRNGFE